MVVLFAFAACGGGGGGKTVKLLGATHGGVVPTGSDLVLLSPDDGSFISTIGSVGFGVTGLEYDAVSNKLYGTTSSQDPSFPDGLIVIDMATGTATTIGTGAGMKISRPTVNSAGEMFAYSQWDGEDGLITVATATGVATTVGTGGFQPDEHGLAFDNGDILYLVDGNGDIHTIDTASGAATFISSINTRAHHGDFHPETGHYWGIDTTYDWGGSFNLLVVDVNTPAILDSLSTVEHLHAITFYYD